MYMKTSQLSNLINYNFCDIFKGMPVGYGFFLLYLISKFGRSKIDNKVIPYEGNNLNYVLINYGANN